MALPLSLSLLQHAVSARPAANKIVSTTRELQQISRRWKKKKKKRISSCVNLPLQSNPTLDIVRKVAGIILGCLLARRWIARFPWTIQPTGQNTLLRSELLSSVRLHWSPSKCWIHAHVNSEGVRRRFRLNLDPTVQTVGGSIHSPATKYHAHSLAAAGSKADTKNRQQLSNLPKSKVWPCSVHKVCFGVKLVFFLLPPTAIHLVSAACPPHMWLAGESRVELKLSLLAADGCRRTEGVEKRGGAGGTGRTTRHHQKGPPPLLVLLPDCLPRS